MTAPFSAPEELLGARDGIYADDLLLAAVAWLDVFSWLVEHPVDLPGLCEGLGLAPRPADVMCTLFRAMGLLEQRTVVLQPTQLARDHLVAGARFASARTTPRCANVPPAASSTTWSSLE